MNAAAARDAAGWPDFAARLIAWQKRAGRHALPWQQTRDAYRIWLSEIMLQQTQVSAVLGYYARFLEAFPTVRELAAASGDQVMALWAGLGYYSRARNLHRCAQFVVERHGGVFPDDPEALAALPGIGRSTAAAIAAFAYGRRAAILDGNVKRVLARAFGIAGDPMRKDVENRMWALAEALLPERGEGIEAYTQGLMDLGSGVCRRGKPGCLEDAALCPFSARCVALAEGRTAELPTPKARKAQPQRQTLMLILRRGGRLLLEKRPPTGIWGGLWSLPQLDASDVAEWTAADKDGQAALDGMATYADPAWLDAAARFGRVLHSRALPEFEHVFTHFRLRVLPLLVELDAKADAPLAASGDAQRAWMGRQEIAGVGLPAPVAKLLDTIN
ncbi:MAG: A/G-specific adenine glycosylase [Candidatus Protistobacter heckmanni]|nr:A/G-specific adenine glycosylase [Candidatus Protistobacter heckmanni]